MSKRLGLVAVLALLLAGCAPAGTAPVGSSEPAPVPRGKPLAAIVEFAQYRERADDLRVLMRIAPSGLSTLPAVPYGDSHVVLSADGATVLFTPTPADAATATSGDTPSGADEVRSIDVSSGAVRTVFRGPAVTYGFDSRGRLLVLGGLRPAYASRTRIPRPPLFGSLVLHTIDGSAATSRSVEASAAEQQKDFRFLAADDRSVFLLGERSPGVTGVEQSVWALDRSSGVLKNLVTFPEDDRTTEDSFWFSEWVQLPSDIVLREGLPLLATKRVSIRDDTGEMSYGIATALELQRMPGMKVTRSLEITQPARTHAFVAALSPELDRYLVRIRSVEGLDPPQPILERGPSGEGTITVPQSLKARPEPVGYLGDDVIYSFFRAPDTRIAIWHRATRTAEEIGGLGSGHWLGLPKLLGVQYEAPR